MQQFPQVPIWLPSNTELQGVHVRSNVQGYQTVKSNFCFPRKHRKHRATLVHEELDIREGATIPAADLWCVPL